MSTTGTHPTGQAAPKNGAPAAPAADTKAVEKKEPTPIQEFQLVLAKMKPEIEKALPAHLNVERMTRIVLTVFRQTPDLLKCTKESVLARIMQCAQLGLEPDGLLGHAWLVPFNNRKNGTKECQLFIGYKGLLKLARNSGEIAGVTARIVQAKDRFEFSYGLEEKLVHVPYMLTDVADDPGEPVYAYAIVRMKDGTNFFEVMSAKEIERIRQNSPSRDSDAWMLHWDEMAKKTATRRVLKLSPLSVEDKMARAIALDERADAGLPQGIDGSDLIDIEPVTPKILSPEGIAVSSLKQRKDVVRLLESARVSETDVAGWFHKSSIDEMSSDEADKALKQLKDMVAKEGAAA